MKHTESVTSSGLVRTLGLVLLWSIMALIVLINLTPFFDDEGALMDFGSFYAAGEKSRHGENPYDPDSEYIFEIVFSQVGAGGKMVNLNPPVSVLLFRLLTAFDPHKALAAWQGFSALLYTGTVLFLAAQYKENISPTKLIWSFLLAAFWHTLVLGQIYIVLLFLGALGWVWLKRDRQFLAGIAIGLVVAIKPNFVVWPFFMLFSGYTAVFLVSMLTGTIISLIPVLSLGTEIYWQWFNASALRLETLIMPGNNSIVGLTSRFDGLSFGILLSLLSVLALMILSRRRPAAMMERTEYISALGIIASLLASPISWTGYTILLLPVFLSLRRWTLPVVAAAVILVIPFQIVLLFFQTSFASFVLFGWLYGWGVLFLLGSLVRNSTITSSIQTN